MPRLCSVDTCFYDELCRYVMNFELTVNMNFELTFDDMKFEVAIFLI